MSATNSDGDGGGGGGCSSSNSSSSSSSNSGGGGDGSDTVIRQTICSKIHMVKCNAKKTGCVSIVMNIPLYSSHKIN